LIFQWIGMMEYICCYGAPAVHWGLLPVTKLARRKIPNEQNIMRRTGPALYMYISLLGMNLRGYIYNRVLAQDNFYLGWLEKI
jgi:hypothetical protein